MGGILDRAQHSHRSGDLVTVPFYTQDELDAALAKERRCIAAFVRRTPPTDGDLQEEQAEWIAATIASGDYHRPLAIDP